MPSDTPRAVRRNVACDECKRRKVRCTAEPHCANCRRDGKRCTYSSPIHRASALEKTVSGYEALLGAVKRAWAIHLPSVSLEQALNNLDVPVPSLDHGSTSQTAPVDPDTAIAEYQPQSAPQTQQAEPEEPEHHNAEEFEFDESHDLGDSVDGMGFLTLEPSKAGYTGPQSGIAALKLLRSLPSVYGINGDDEALAASSKQSSPITVHDTVAKVDVSTFVDHYFQYYHPAYPLLHEGSFRAKVSGALAKPRDGSWPLLYNMVLAVGAFAGDSHGSHHDLEFFRCAKEAISLSVVEKGSITYVQGLALMADYLQKRNKPNAGFALVGVAWSMAMAIGLHREFGPHSTTAFAMELRRRTWWALFTFVSSAQLTLGRPPASLIGINVRLPVNANDNVLAVDMTELPISEAGPTVASSLIAQIPLATIANEVQAALLTYQVPPVDVVMRLDNDIEAWTNGLPSRLSPLHHLEQRFELPKRVLLWRSHHLIIVLNRPFLFQAITRKQSITGPDAQIQRCIAIASICVESICGFVNNQNGLTRGFAWYATYWLISASFIHAICFAYQPDFEGAEEWKMRLQQSIEALKSLSFSHGMADRARGILQRFHDSYASPTTTHAVPANALPQFMASNFGFSMSGESLGSGEVPQWMSKERNISQHDAYGGDLDAMWSWQPAPYAEMWDVAEGSTFNNYHDGVSML